MSVQTIRIGHWQLACAPGDYEANIAKVIAGLERADAEGVRIVSFPESFLTGYFDREELSRRYSWAVGDRHFSDFLARTARFEATVIAGFNESRGGNLHISALVARGGKLLGVYRKAFPCAEYETPGREFPIFEREGVRFGVILCADGGYVEPARILALSGARIVFAPHYNYIKAGDLLGHFMQVRADHTARAIENGVWFLRGNSVTADQDAGFSYEGIGYGDSYLIDPGGEITVRSRRHVECFISADIDPGWPTAALVKARISAAALGRQVLELAMRPG